MTKKEAKEKPGAGKEKAAPKTAAHKAAAGAEGTRAVAKHEARKGGATAGLPPYLVVLLIVMALAFGYMVRTVLQPVPHGLQVEPGLGTPTDNTQPTGPLRPIDTILLFSSKCKICEQGSTMLTFFDNKGIKYNLEKVDTESEKGQNLVKEYTVKEVPALLVKADDIKQDKEVGANFQRYFELKGDRFLVVEPDLDKVTRPKYFLEPRDESCLLEKKPKVFLFDDPYCPSCLINRVNLNELRDKFADQVDFVYSYLATDSKKLIASVGADETERAAKYLTCAQLQGKIKELDAGLVNKLCDITGDGTATNFEILACQTSKNLAKPLSKDALDKLAKNAGMDMNSLNGCVDTAKNEFDRSFNRSLAYNVRVTPLAVVDCKYVVHVADLKKALCEMFPDNAECKVTKG